MFAIEENIKIPIFAQEFLLDALRAAIFLAVVT